MDQTLSLNISCDNPACPGNELDPTDRTGWLFISSEVYGQETQQHVFCSETCVNAVTAENTPPVFEREPPAERLSEPLVP